MITACVRDGAETASVTFIAAGIEILHGDVEIAVLGVQFDGDSYSNEPESVSALAASLRSIGVGVVTLEVASSNEAEVACILQAAGLAVAIVTPRTMREFARQLHTVGKHDRKKKELLAEFSAWILHRQDFVHLLGPLAEEHQRWLAAIVSRRRHLHAMLNREREQLLILPRRLHASVQAIAAAIQAQLEEIDGQIFSCARGHAAEIERQLEFSSGSRSADPRYYP